MDEFMVVWSCQGDNSGLAESRWLALVSEAVTDSNSLLVKASERPGGPGGSSLGGVAMKGDGEPTLGSPT